MTEGLLDARGLLRALNEYGDARAKLADRRHTPVERTRLAEAEARVGAELRALIAVVVSAALAASAGGGTP